MKKVFLLLLLLFINFVYAHNEILDISTNERTSIYKLIEYSSSVNNIEEAISNPQKFKEIEYFRRYLHFRQIEKMIFLKVNLNNNLTQKLQRQIYTKWKNANIDFYLVENKKIIFKEKLKKYGDFQLSNTFIIGEKRDVQLYLKVNIKQNIDDFLYFYISSPEDIHFLIGEKEKYHNGIFLGLLITMMMYNFFMYFSMKVKSYLYLGLYQLMIIIYVSNAKYVFFDLFANATIIFWSLKVLFFILAFTFSVLFTKEFLNTKNKMPYIDKLLNVFLVLNILLIPMIGVINYLEFLYALFIVAGFYSLKQGNKFAFFYILGFLPTVIFYIFMNIIRVCHLDIDIVYQNYIQILAVIEAFALSMALYLKLKDTVDEKEKAQNEVFEKEKMILEQSKFATMGEMIGNIAHQWRQPLNNISSILVNLSFKNELDKLDKEFVRQKIEQSNKQLQYMSKTIEDFRNFFKSSEQKRYFSAAEICKESIELMSAAFKSNQIELKKDLISDFLFEANEGELNQVLLILLSNAKDALVQSNQTNKIINIVIEKNMISIEDNAGGIDKEIINKIFDPYFSTKDKKVGTGLGLYIAKIIIEEKNKWSLSVENIKDGACFIINFKEA